MSVHNVASASDALNHGNQDKKKKAVQGFCAAFSKTIHLYTIITP